MGNRGDLVLLKGSKLNAKVASNIESNYDRWRNISLLLFDLEFAYQKPNNSFIQS